MNCLEMKNQLSSLGKLGVTFLTIVVTMALYMFVQLESCDKYFGTLWTFIGLFLDTADFVGICIWLLFGILMSFKLGLIVLDAFARMIVDVEYFIIAQLLLASNAADWLIVFCHL